MKRGAMKGVSISALLVATRDDPNACRLGENFDS